MLNCKDASHLISQRLECPLGTRERWALWMHLLMCHYCRRFARQLLTIHRALRMLGPGLRQETALSDLSPEARERIAKTLSEQQGSRP